MNKIEALNEKALEAAHVAYETFNKVGALKTNRLKDEHLASVIRAYLTASDAEREPVAWLPTATVKWLEEYEGPACGTQTVAHNRPIKSDGGIPVYLSPPTSELEALRKRVAELEKALNRAENTACRGLDEGDTRDALIDIKFDLRAARRVREAHGGER